MTAFLTSLGIGIGLILVGVVVRKRNYRYHDGTGWFFAGSFVIAVTLLVAGITSLVYTQCHNQGEEVGLPVVFRPLGGCFVEIDGQTYPFDERALPLIIDQKGDN